MAKLPHFKPSGAGLQSDLKQILLAQSMTWSSWRNEFKKIFENPIISWVPGGGLNVVDGEEVLYCASRIENETFVFPGNGYHELFTHLGFEDSDIEQITATAASSKVEDIHITWKEQYGYTQSDFEYIIENLKDVCGAAGISYIKLFTKNVRYRELNYPTEPERLLVDSPQNLPPHTETGSIAGPHDESNPMPPWGHWTTPNHIAIKLFMEQTECRIFNAADEDITDAFEIETADGNILAETLMMLAITDSGANTMPFVSSVKIGEEVMVVDEGTEIAPNLQNHILVLGEERYNYGIDSSLDEDVSLWIQGDATMLEDDEDYATFGGATLRPSYFKAIMSSYIWAFRRHYLASSSASGDYAGANRPFIEKNGVLMMRVKWLDSVSMEEALLVISTTFDIYVHPKKKSGCCGVGGIVGSLLGGIMTIVGAIGKMLSFIVDKFYEIPIVREVLFAFSFLLAEIFNTDMKNIEIVIKEITKVVLVVALTCLFTMCLGSEAGVAGTGVIESGIAGAEHEVTMSLLEQGIEMGAVEFSQQQLYGLAAIWETTSAMDILIYAIPKVQSVYFGSKDKMDQADFRSDMEANNASKVVAENEAKTEALDFDQETLGDFAKFESTNNMAYSSDPLNFNPYEDSMYNPFDKGGQFDDFDSFSTF